MVTTVVDASHLVFVDNLETSRGRVRANVRFVLREPRSIQVEIFDDRLVHRVSACSDVPPDTSLERALEAATEVAERIW